MADIAAERDYLIAHAKECESAADDILRDVARLDRYIGKMRALPDQ